jgi:threonine dehydratase
MLNLRAAAVPLVSDGWPVALQDVESARARLHAHLRPTPVQEYPVLNDVVGNEIRVFVKHENHQPTRAERHFGSLRCSRTACQQYHAATVR